MRELDRAELEEDQRDADRERQVGDPVDDERLDRGGAGGRPVIPVADQQIGAEADALPAEEQLRQVVGGHQHQHGEGEQRQVGEEAVARAGFVAHVADRIDMDQHRHERHHRHHHGRQRVVAQRPFDVEPAGLDPGAEIEHAGLGATRQLEERQRPADRRDHHPEDGRAHRGLVADRPAKQSGHQGARQRREDGKQRKSCTLPRRRQQLSDH